MAELLTESSRSSRSLEPGAVVLLTGLAIALYEQGAFYARDQWISGVVLLAGVVLTSVVIRRGDGGGATFVVAAALAGWSLLDGFLHGTPTRALPYLVLLAGFVAVQVCCSSLPAVSAEWLLHGILAVGVGVALIGWFGVLVHDQRWAFQSEGLWRASSTLSYPNAAAAVLAMLAPVALALLVQRPGCAWYGFAATVLLAGLGATASRAGLIALAVGLIVLAALLGPWRVIRRTAAPVLGSAVAMVGLTPAMIDAAVAHRVAATAALVVGCLVGAYLPAAPARGRAGVVMLMALVIGLLWRWFGGGHDLREVISARMTLESPDRAGSNVLAWHLFEAHPWLGAGPGLERLSATQPGGGLRVYRYAHDEYLQVLAELGIVGALLLIGAVVLVLRRLYRFRQTSGATGVGVLAGMAALAVHAAFDFIWHFPAIPLTAAALVGLAVRQPPDGRIHPLQPASEKELP